MDGSFCVATAEELGKHFARDRFRTLRAQVPTLKGLEIRDRNGKEETSAAELVTGKLTIKEGNNLPGGMKVVLWNRYEIENYLIHPKAILRLVSQLGDEQTVNRAEKFMIGQLPPILFEEPFSKTGFDNLKGKTIIADILAAAGMKLGDADYYRIAGVMKSEEIHPDVVAMLDLINLQFSETIP